MYIQKIKLIDFRNFEGEHEFSFRNMTIVNGKNGTGKSTLIVDAVMFALYGYSVVNLATLPTRGKSKKCTVCLEILHKSSIYTIERTYSTRSQIIITKDGKTIDVTEKQKYLNELFKTEQYFQKFRMLDIQRGINILESSGLVLRKTLLSLNQDIFNKIRVKLTADKHQREIFNKDNLHGCVHYPSEKRENFLKTKSKTITTELNGLRKDLYGANNIINGLFSNKGNVNGKVISKQTQKHKLSYLNTCPTCFQSVPDIHKNRVTSQLNKEIQALRIEINKFETEIKVEKECYNNIKSLESKFLHQENRIQILLTELKQSLENKDYQYTTQDVVLYKKAILELDSFLEYYITEWIKLLEPVINNIVNKIGFVVKFVWTDKGKFDIILEKNGAEFVYKDLSTGQRLILTIAFQLALLMERGEDGVIVADEGFSSLDDENLDVVFTLFSNFPFQLICVLHRVNTLPGQATVIYL